MLDGPAVKIETIRKIPMLSPVLQGYALGESDEQDKITKRERQYNIHAVYYDPYQMIASAQRLAREGLLMVEFPQTVSNLTESSQNLFDLIKGRNLLLYPEAAIRLAISRAVAIETLRLTLARKSMRTSTRSGLSSRIRFLGHKIAAEWGGAIEE